MEKCEHKKFHFKELRDYSYEQERSGTCGDGICYTRKFCEGQLVFICDNCGKEGIVDLKKNKITF